MGYDMRIEGPPTAEEEAKVREAQAAFDASVKERNSLPDRRPGDDDAAQEKVDAAYEALHAADISYFRLNIWGMSDYLYYMHQLGMLAVDYDMPSFPQLPDGITWDDMEAAEAPPGDGSSLPVKAEAVAHLKAREAHVAWHPEPAFGIAQHKFGSNDGWLVTPQEIKAALESYRTHSGDEVKVIVGTGEGRLEYWLKWIAYLERAQHRGGFRVW
ncbi:hypothetical protein AB0M87_04595 [Streptomyces sp. NPDC051320]|uniref:hypothetical protein n=1 Tax=Streptomyces sp. NPDC051320 TaxID=3154644 RepID=UPI003429297C